ncbi:helix-turn-helix domain-containing protein [Myroides sp. WP-1]|uniref:helix-turn-helix domain-containing protein n=1 Tax=Myroides sp. WP-1 TaxID=2759944 RepID=UPI0021020CD6|nr:helix-turn-helix domain-containing protein [Myroides sp. WP-1]
MVCPRCILLIHQEFQALQVEVKTVRLGEVEVFRPLVDTQLKALEERLVQLGFELLVDDVAIIVEQIKRKIIEYAEAQPILPVNLSDYIATVATMSYARMARLFVQHTHLTIERYYILYRIERVKELISYCEYSLEEIAQQLHYKDASHMSKQFKKIVGISPSIYRKNQSFERKFLDDIIT